MAYGETENLTATESMLREAGFAVSQLCRSRRSCFDFAARRKKALVFIKVQPDVGTLSRNDSQELRAISESFSATPLLIGMTTREKPLEDDTVYTRHDVPAVTARTFENVVLHDTPPLIQANPGGYYVEIDGEALKQRRQELGLSAGEMAEMAGISRRTLYGYERGMAKASVTVAYNMIWALGVPVATPVDILGKPRGKHKRCILTKAERVFARNRFLVRIFRKFTRCHITAVKRAPFDFVINVPDKEMRIIGGVVDEEEPRIGKRVDEILSVSKIVQGHPVLITDGHKLLEKGIPCISSEEVSRIRDPAELIASII